MLVIDSHLDIAWNALQWNRDQLRSAHEIRAAEKGKTGKARGNSTVGLPDLCRGRVALSIVTVLTRSTGNPVEHIDYDSPTQAHAIGRGQLEYYHCLAREGHVRVLTDAPALQKHMNQWQAWDAQSDANPNDTPPLGFVVSMEGADPILRPDCLEEWWNDGLRLIGLSHYGPGRYAGGTGTEIGVRDIGYELLKEMQRLGVLLDLTHLSDTAFWEAVEHYDGPVLASHQNARELVPAQRQFTDEQLKVVFERDGVVGVAFDCWMLKPGWVVGESDPKAEGVTLETVVRQIEYICDLAGSARHVAIGTDLDGGFGTEQSPADLDTIADLQRFPELLSARGFSGDDIAAILHGNWWRFLHGNWSKK